MTVTSGSEYCEVTAHPSGVDDGRMCVTDGPGNYGTSESCVIEAVGDVMITTEEIDIQVVTANGEKCAHTYFMIVDTKFEAGVVAPNTRYCGNSDGSTGPPDGPEDVSIAAGGTMKWASGGPADAIGGAFPGFKICAVPWAGGPNSGRRLAAEELAGLSFSSDNYCAEGATGPLCSLCLPSYRESETGQCVLCDASFELVDLVPLLVITMCASAPRARATASYPRATARALALCSFPPLLLTARRRHVVCLE